MNQKHNIIFRHLGLCAYATCWKMMQTFTETRHATTFDQIWLVEHFPVFTQGQAGKPEHLLAPGDIPVIQSDRGGQVTYHGPGQLVTYLLLDLRRKGFTLKTLIHSLESSIIELLAEYGIPGARKYQAPGVYVNHAKIASLGLRVKRGCSYHGLSLNVNMDLEPFSRINPCGYPNLTVVQMRDFKNPIEVEEIAPKLIDRLMHHLNYSLLITENKDKIYDAS